MRRFYLRIYLALFASLAVFAVLAGMTAGLLRLFDDRPARSWPAATTDIAERLLPSDRDREFACLRTRILERTKRL